MNKSPLAPISILLSLISISAFLLFTSTALAVEASPSSTPEDTVKSLKERIKENLPGAQEQLDQQAAVARLKAFVGTIESISGKTITITTTGGVKQAQVDDQTEIVFAIKAKPQLADLPVGHSIIAIGTTSDFQVQVSKRLIVYAAPEVTPRRVYLAEIVDLDVATRTIYLQSPDLNPKTKIKISTRALFFDRDLNKILLTKLPLEQKAIVVLHDTADGFVLTRLILSTAPTTAASACGDTVCASDESPETCPQDCQS